MKYKNPEVNDNLDKASRLNSFIKLFKENCNQFGLRSNLYSFYAYVRNGEQKKAMVRLYLMSERLQELYQSKGVALAGYIIKKNMELYGKSYNRILRLIYYGLTYTNYEHHIIISSLEKPEYQKTILDLEKDMGE